MMSCLLLLPFGIVPVRVALHSTAMVLGILLTHPLINHIILQSVHNIIVVCTYMGLKAVYSVANGRVCVVVEQLQVMSDTTTNGRLQLRKH